MMRNLTQGHSQVRSNEMAVAVPEPSHCRVVSDPHQGIMVFRLQGQLDASTAPGIYDLLVAASNEHEVIIDLLEVDLIDAEGVATLRDVILAVAHQGGRVAVVRRWRVAKDLWKLFGTEGMVFLALTVPSALNWFRNCESQLRSPDEATAIVLPSF